MKKFLIMTAAILAAAGGTSAQNQTGSTDLNEKTFPASDRVTTRKVHYYNRMGIDIVGDLYLPDDLDSTRRHTAIVVGHPYGGVKEQSSGLYAQTLAERGFVALAFDLSYNGESGGQPRRISTPEGYVEDFMAAVDFIGTRPFVDRERIGAIGICGSGCFAVSAAALDLRIRAVATVSMYDMGRASRQGLHDVMTEAQRQELLARIAEQRWSEFEGAPVAYNAGTPRSVDNTSDPVAREFFGYYRTPRGQHPHSTTEISLTSTPALMNFFPFAMIRSISPRPLLFIAGDAAHSRYFSEDAYALAAEPKELYIVPGAGHVDLYDRTELIPFDKLEAFFRENLK